MPRLRRGWRRIGQEVAPYAFVLHQGLCQPRYATACNFSNRRPTSYLTYCLLVLACTRSRHAGSSTVTEDLYCCCQLLPTLPQGPFPTCSTAVLIGRAPPKGQWPQSSALPLLYREWCEGQDVRWHSVSGHYLREMAKRLVGQSAELETAEILGSNPGAAARDSTGFSSVASRWFQPSHH